MNFINWLASDYMSDAEKVIWAVVFGIITVGIFLLREKGGGEMKKINKEFWVSEQMEIRHLTPECNGAVLIRNVKSCKTPIYKHKLTISWEVPEKKIELTETDVENAIREVIGYGVSDLGIKLINEKLFGGSNE